MMMISPITIFDVVRAWQDANMWFSWGLLVVMLLVSGWFINKATDGDMDWSMLVVGLGGSVLFSFLVWPVLIAGIPVFVGFGVLVAIMYLPKWIMGWVRIYKQERAASKAMVDNS